MGRMLGVAALLVLATCFAYAEVGGHGFVDFDDWLFVTENDVVRRGLTSDGLRWALTATEACNWQPVTWLSHMVDVELHGLDAGGHHRSNLILHVLAALLLLAALRSLTGSLVPSAAAAALFALHPLHVESVAWIAERRDVLSGVFLAATLLAWGAWARRGGTARYLLVVLLLALGLAAKPMLVTLPFVLLLLDVWPLGRLRGGPAPARSAPEPRARSAAGLLIEKLPLFGLAAAMAIATLATQRAGGTVADVGGVPLGARVATSLVAYVWYLAKIVWPSDLAAFYPHPYVLGEGFGALAAAGSLALLAAIGAACVALRRRAPCLLVGWLWYLGMLVPVIGLVQVGGQFTADRYAYLPAIGVYLGLCFGLAVALRARPRLALPVGIAAAGIAVVMVGATRTQVRVWRDSEALARRALSVTRGNWIAHAILGAVLRQRGDVAEAEEQFRLALEIHPGYDTALYNLAEILEQRGDQAGAEALYAQAVAADPNDGQALNRLGWALLGEGRMEEAQRLFERAAALTGSAAIAEDNLGWLHDLQGRRERAEGHYRRALELDPRLAAAHDHLGNLLRREGRTEEAALGFQRAIELDPLLATGHSNLGLVRYEQGRLEEALEHFGDAVAANPDLAAAHGNLGLALASLGRSEEARESYGRALAIDPELADVHHNLAVELYAAGRVEPAIDHWREAVRLDPDFALAHYDLALAFAAAGANQPARHHLGEVLRADPDFEYADYVRELLEALPAVR